MLFWCVKLPKEIGRAGLSINAGAEEVRMLCETLLKHTTLTQKKICLQIYWIQLRHTKSRQHYSQQNIESVKKQRAWEQNYLLPLEWADVIIILSPRTAVEGREHWQNLCKICGCSSGVDPVGQVTSLPKYGKKDKSHYNLRLRTLLGTPGI